MVRLIRRNSSNECAVRGLMQLPFGDCSMLSLKGWASIKRVEPARMSLHRFAGPDPAVPSSRFLRSVLTPAISRNRLV